MAGMSTYDESKHARGGNPTNTGEYSAKVNSAPEGDVLDSGPALLAVGGEPRDVVFIDSGIGDGYIPLSFPEARLKLNIPEDEPDSVVTATIALLRDSGSYPPYISAEPGYADPGEESIIDTEDWETPADGMTWLPAAEAWRDAGTGDNVVLATAAFTLQSVGYTEDESEAAAAIAGDHIADHPDDNWDRWGGDNVHIHDGELRIRTRGAFLDEEFSPRVVAHKLADLKATDPRERLRQVKAQGVVIKNADLIASRGIDGKAVAYAATQGRVPNDAEAVAIAGAFDTTSTIRYGYAVGKTEFAVAPGAETLVASALDAWLTNRQA